MKPKSQPRTYAQPLLGAARLDLILNMDHGLVKLAEAIDWEGLAQSFGPLYAETGRPGIPIRLMAGLLMLQHIEGISDEAVVARWPDSVYWQHFCGEELFRHDFPVNPSQLHRWRKRIGEAGVERLLKASIDAGLKLKAVTPRQMQVAVVDTTVQPKAVEHPTDARLYRKVLMNLWVYTLRTAP